MHEELIPIFFFLFVFGVVAVGMWRRLMVERERQQTIRLALEKGQALDPALVEKMMAPPSSRAPYNPFAWPIGILSAGVGLAVFGIFMRQIEDDAFWPLAGSGAMVAIVGAGLLLSVYLRSRFIGSNGNGRG